MYTKSPHRFVKEYANYKIVILTAMAESFPERAEYCKAKIETIETWLGCWDRCVITTDEVMGMISKL